LAQFLCNANNHAAFGKYVGELNHQFKKCEKDKAKVVAVVIEMCVIIE